MRRRVGREDNDSLFYSELRPFWMCRGREWEWLGENTLRKKARPKKREVPIHFGLHIGPFRIFKKEGFLDAWTTFLRIKDEEYADLDGQGKLKKEGEETKGAVKLQYSKVIPAVRTPSHSLSLIHSFRRFVKLWSRMWITMINWMYWERRSDLMKTKEQLHSLGQMQQELLVWWSMSNDQIDPSSFLPSGSNRAGDESVIPQSSGYWEDPEWRKRSQSAFTTDKFPSKMTVHFSWTEQARKWTDTRIIFFALFYSFLCATHETLIGIIIYQRISLVQIRWRIRTR